jgi:predicted TIM-barrel fold metal-dependent hydrolase
MVPLSGQDAGACTGEEETTRVSEAGPIDCDLHPTVPGLKALLPYLDEHWRETAVRCGFDELVTIAYPSINPLTARADWRDTQGKGATSPERLAVEALAPFGTQLAICNCLYGAQAPFSEDIAAAFCRAVNDWMAREWLDRDERLRASIVVPMLNAELAAAEIDRIAPDRRFVQVLLLVSGELPLGRRQNWPIFAATERHGLPVGIHAGSTYRHPVTPVGWPSSFVEDYVDQASGFQSQLTSLIAEGVFSKFPALTVVLLESGVTWLPAYLWRLTKFWKGLRSEVPWVSDPPASIVRERVRLTLQPFDAPPEPEAVMRVIEHIGSDEILLFSTDYPHWQFEGAAAIPDGLDPALARKIMVENPRRTYSRLQETVS